MSVQIKTEQVLVETEEMDEELQLLEDSGGESYQIEYTEPQISQSRRHNSQNSNMNSNSKNSSGGNNNKNMLESEKRIRREIANSNERRRMQSINAGFQNLRSLLPRHEGDKLSKAAILQQTSHYICELENQKTQLLAQNSQLKRQLGLHESANVTTSGGNGNVETTTTSGGEGGGSGVAGAIKKRKITDNVINVQAISDSSDEGLGSMSPEPMTLLSASNAQIAELKKQMEKERRLRTLLEEELQMIKRQLYSVATAPTTATVSGGATYIPREVIEHTDNLMREEDIEELSTVSYVEIDEMTGQQQVVVCSSIEELESEGVQSTEIITDDNVQEEIILSSNSSTESEHEVKVNAIAKAYASGSSPTVLPILQAIKATPKVEVERINEAKSFKVKAEKIEQPGLTRSRQNLETIVEAIRHLEGDHLFADGEQKLQQRGAQDAPLALTTKQAQRNAIAAELRPYLHLKSNQVTIVTRKSRNDSSSGNGCNNVGASVVGGGCTTVLSSAGATTVVSGGGSNSSNATVMPTAIFKVQTNNTNTSSGGVNGGGGGSGGGGNHVTITTSAVKQQCRPGVIVAKQVS